MLTEAAVKAEETLIHVLWINAGLSCDGDSVALTAATQPTVEDRPGRAAWPPQDRHPLAADRLRERSGRRGRRFHRMVLQGRPRRARTFRAGGRGIDPQRSHQGRGLLVRVREQPRHRSAYDHQRVARPAGPPNHPRGGGGHLRPPPREPPPGPPTPPG